LGDRLWDEGKEGVQPRTMQSPIAVVLMKKGEEVRLSEGGFMSPTMKLARWMQGWKGAALAAQSGALGYRGTGYVKNSEDIALNLGK